MKRTLLSLFAMLSLAISTHAQSLDGGCGTSAPPAATLNWLEQLMAQPNTWGIETTDTIIRVPIKAHFVTDVNGKTFSYKDLLDVICELNAKYNPAKIFFYLRPNVNVIRMPIYNPLQSFAAGNQLMLDNNINRAVNVHFTNLGAMGLCGYATYPGTGAGSTMRQGGMVMGTNGNCSSPGNTTFAHEMGHYLSLPHPFDETENDPDNAATAERVTRNTQEVLPRLRANCATAGDRFCDTPADFIGTRWNCAGPLPVQLDINGDQFQPDPTLYMSYSLDFCQNRFSPSQITAMRATIPGMRGYLLQPAMPSLDTVRTAPLMMQPVQNDTNVVSNFAFFKWQAVPGATHYCLQIARSANFSDAIVDTFLTDTQYLYTANRMVPNATYRWRVKAFNWQYTCAPISNAWSFRSGAPFGVHASQLLEEEVELFPTVIEPGNVLRVRFSEASTKAFNLTILDLHGKQVKQFASNPADQEGSISLEDLRSGMYLVQLVRDGRSMNKKIIVR